MAAEQTASTPRWWAWNTESSAESGEACRHSQSAAGPAGTAAQTAAVRKAMENFDLRPQLPRISAQTLVISGRHDPLNPPAEGKVVADLIPGSRFEIFEHSGHVPRLEEREVYLQRVGEFLAQ